MTGFELRISGVGSYHCSNSVRSSVNSQVIQLISSFTPLSIDVARKSFVWNQVGHQLGGCTIDI